MKNKQLSPLLFSTVGVVAMAVILIAVNVISGIAKTRIDLTEEKLYTLSPGTKAILSKLDTPVKIRFYFSRTDNNMPVVLKSFAGRVEDLLNEYRQASNGQIEIEKLDPQPDSDAEDSANLDGIEGQMVSLGEKIYLGLSIRCVDQSMAIPFISPEREKLLEYDLSRAIAQVTATEKPVVGVMTPLPMFGTPMNPMMMQMGQQGQEPWIVLNELKRDFEVKQVEMSVDSIPDDIKVLVVIHPKNISEAAQFAIDQFVLRGGKLIAYLDPLSIVDSRGQQNPMQRMASGGSSLEKLLKAWGLEFDTSKVVADMNFATQISRGARPETMPVVLSLNADAVNTNDVATSQMDNLLLPFAGVFTGTPVSGLSQTVLLKTTEDSQLVERMMAEMGGDQIARDFKASGNEYPLAVRLTGKFKTAFPEGKPGAATENKEGEAAVEKPADNSLKESQADGAVVLIGDSDMLFDQFVAQVQNVFGQRIIIPANANLNLVQSLTEQMGGDSNLIGVRSRATLNRPFTVVRKMQAQAEDSYRAKIKELETELSTAQQRLNELQQQKGEGQRMIVSPEQQKEIEQFRKREAEVKKELKDVRKQLRRDIVSLENRLKWINIAGMPLLVTVSGVALALVKRKRTSAK